MCRLEVARSDLIDEQPKTAHGRLKSPFVDAPSPVILFRNVA
jgi:hypothetical protein